MNHLEYKSYLEIYRQVVNSSTIYLAYLLSKTISNDESIHTREEAFVERAIVYPVNYILLTDVNGLF
jgi:hypothetical protein